MKCPRFIKLATFSLVLLQASLITAKLTDTEIQELNYLVDGYKKATNSLTKARWYSSLYKAVQNVAEVDRKEATEVLSKLNIDLNKEYTQFSFFQKAASNNVAYFGTIAALTLGAVYGADKLAAKYKVRGSGRISGAVDTGVSRAASATRNGFNSTLSYLKSFRKPVVKVEASKPVVVNTPVITSTPAVNVTPAVAASPAVNTSSVVTAPVVKQ